MEAGRRASASSRRAISRGSRTRPTSPRVALEDLVQIVSMPLFRPVGRAAENLGVSPRDQALGKVRFRVHGVDTPRAAEFALQEGTQKVACASLFFGFGERMEEVDFHAASE